MSNYKSKLNWPKTYTTVKDSEQEKIIYVTPNLYLRVTLGLTSKDGITPEYIFWPDVLWRSNENIDFLYLESYNPVNSELEAIKTLEIWLDNFYSQINNTNIFKNDQ